MPKENVINCPACGFTLKAGSKTCEFCGYEFEEDDVSSFEASRRTVKDSPLTQVSGRTASPKDNTKKGNGSSRKGAKGSPRTADAKDTGSRATSPSAVTQSAAVEPVAPLPRPSVGDSHPQQRIRELERQLTDAEKELDEISKLLGPGHEKQSQAAVSSPAAAGASAPSNMMPPGQVVSSRLGSRPVSASAYGGAGTGVAASGYAGARERVRFRFRGMTAGAIIVGLAVYALSFMLRSNISLTEMYMLILPASILVALGIYASLQAIPSPQRT